MTQGSGHDEDAFYQIVCADFDSGFCYLVEVADSEKLESVEAVDTMVGMQVADIKKQKCTDKDSMEQEPQVHELEGKHLLSQHLPLPYSSQQNPMIS